MSSVSQRANQSPDVGTANHAPSRFARRLHQICLGVFSEITEPHDLSPVEYGALASLHIEPGIDQTRLAAIVGIDLVSAHHMVEEFEARHLLRRDVDPKDRRARVLRLTAKGTRLFLGLLPQARAAHEQILGPLSEAERETFLELLKRVVEANSKYARPGNGRRRSGPRRRSRLGANPVFIPGRG